MRGGAIPILVWASILLLSAATNAVWTGDTIQMATFAAALVAILTLVGVLVIRDPQALRRGGGPRSSRVRIEALPRASFAAAFTAVGFGALIFGFAFGHFIIYFGAGMMVAGLGRLAGELRAQHRAQQQAEGRP